MKLYIGFFVVITFNSAYAEEYISPHQYKGYTCAELNEDLNGLSSAYLKTVKQSMNNQISGQEFQKANEQYQAKVKAIEAAAKKIQCDLNGVQ